MRYKSGDQIVEAIQWDGTLESLNPLLTCGRWPTLAVDVRAGGILKVPTPPIDTPATPGNYITYFAPLKTFNVVPSAQFESEFDAV